MNKPIGPDTDHSRPNFLLNRLAFVTSMGLATIISVIAFFVAMVALWLSSDIGRKVESQNENFVRAHIAGLREEMRDMDKVLTKAHRSVKQQENAQSGLDGRLDDHTKALQALAEQISKLSARLEELDNSIPPRYRMRTAKADQKQTEKQAPKPSIQ